MIETKAVDAKNESWVHQIFPGEKGKFWVNFNWYWLYISRRQPKISAQFLYLAGETHPIGFVAFGKHFQDRQLKVEIDGAYELYHMVVDACEQGRGCGRSATMHVLKKMASEKDCREVRLACHPLNKVATELYLSMGFREIGRNYDDDPLYAIEPEAILAQRMSTGVRRRDSSDSIGREGWTAESLLNEKQFNWDGWEQGIDC